jgi:hypothetical protein
VTVIIGNRDVTKAIENAIHDALRDDSRYLFVTLTGDGFELGWKLSLQWGSGLDCRKLPDVQLSEDEHSPAHVVWRVKQGLAKFDAIR